MNEYRFIYDEHHIIEALTRFRGQRKAYPWAMVVKGICFLGLAALLAIVVYAAFRPVQGPAIGLIFLALVPAFFMLLLAMGPRIDYFFLKRQLKRSPFYGGEVHMIVAHSGVSVRTPMSQLALSWAAYTQAKRLGDGYLLSMGPGSVYWWPDSRLAAGTAESVGQLLRANITSYAGPDA